MSDSVDWTGGRAALLAPGSNYGPDGPLLMFGGTAALERGAELHPVDWGTLDDSLSDDDLNRRVEATVALALDSLGPAAAPLLIGKSLGTRAAAVLGEVSTAVERFLDDTVWPV